MGTDRFSTRFSVGADIVSYDPVGPAPDAVADSSWTSTKVTGSDASLFIAEAAGTRAAG